MEYHKLGDTFVHPVTVLDSSGNPVNADSTPTYKIKRSGSTVATGTCTAYSGETGQYYISHDITTGNGFADGDKLQILVAAVVSSVTKAGFLVSVEVGCPTPDLDDVSVTKPTGVASTLRQMMIQSWMRFFNPSKLDRGNNTLETFDTTGNTRVTLQTATYDEENDIEQIGNAS